MRGMETESTTMWKIAAADEELSSVSSTYEERITREIVVDVEEEEEEDEHVDVVVAIS